ncbi:hypothetical protein [Clavibacter zhangzhiyongii]|uniref:Uncharacterized protein n=1 Tax=Clavibacter zhangzhiyongii TaxID=2768071 RepID=A0A7L7YYU8_9MICO|nr:hypothetical protein [Clavibacter zhangzhiyongii]QOD42624.1 hypothetical protein H9X71_08170 [Clavibacter zhangzhiyongii]
MDSEKFPRWLHRLEWMWFAVGVLMVVGTIASIVIDPNPSFLWLQGVLGLIFASSGPKLIRDLRARRVAERRARLDRTTHD